MKTIIAPATFLGIQEGIPGLIPDIELWNLTDNACGKPAGSTVSRTTLESGGFFVPKAQFNRAIAAA